MSYTKFAIGYLFSFVAAFCSTSFAAGTFRVATYNVENYLDQPTESRPHAKSAEASAKIRESIESIKPDVLALEEMGTTNALLELRASLKADGLDFPFWEHVSGADTNIHVAVLSRLPIVARRPHTNDLFLLDGRQFRGGARLCRGGHPGRDELHLHADCRAFEIAAAIAGRRRSRGAPRARQKFCAASLTNISPTIRTPGSSCSAISTT